MKDTDFQTPLPICKYMVSLLPIDITTTLEPTPGNGNIVSELTLKGYRVVAPENFYAMKRNIFDAIVMNPPFSPMKVGYEILFSCMGMSDHIIALLPWLSIINSQKRTEKIVGFGLKSITHLPRNAFPGSRVQTCILELCRFYSGNTIFKLYEEK